MRQESEQPLVVMKNISKEFGKVKALKNVDFSIGHQEVVGLLGDNGAGKSTLIKILVGLYPPGSGEIYFDGRKVHFTSPQDARALGIETVYQDLALVGLMSISRNFFLGREIIRKIGPFRFLDKRGMDEACQGVLAEIGVGVRSPSENVEFLSGGERQAVSIGRAMHFGAKLLILDEPTAALSIKETNKVLDYVLQARERGLSVIYITHNIYHVYPIANRFTILDRGIKLGEFDKTEITPERIIEIISKTKG
jgi:simple sugar transport system ATP-binding protein